MVANGVEILQSINVKSFFYIYIRKFMQIS